jgi:TonB family protein
MNKLYREEGRKVHTFKLWLVFGLLWVISMLGACTAYQQGNSPLQLISGSAPIYPDALKSRGIEGKVTVQYDVTMEGQVANLRVVESDPRGLFDAAALTAVSTWVFRPQIRDGQAQVVTDITSNLTFQKP